MWHPREGVAKFVHISLYELKLIDAELPNKLKLMDLATAWVGLLKEAL